MVRDGVKVEPVEVEVKERNEVLRQRIERDMTFEQCLLSKRQVRGKKNISRVHEFRAGLRPLQIKSLPPCP